MATGNLPDLKAVLGLDVTQFNTGMKQAREQAARASDALSGGFGPAATQIEGVGKAAALSGNQIAELGHISRSIGGTLMAGGSIFQALGYEANRLVSVLTIGNGGIGGTLSAIGGGLVSLLGPVGLTIAGVALLAGGIYEFSGKSHQAAKDAKVYSDALKVLTSATTAYKSANQGASQGMDKLTGEFGQNAYMARELLGVQRDMAQMEAQKAMIASNKAIEKAYGNYTIPSTASAGFEHDRSAQQFGQPFSDPAAATDYANAVSKLAEKLKIAVPDAQDLAAKLKDVSTSTTAQGIADAANAARLQILQASGGFGKMNTDAQSLYSYLADVALKALEIQQIDIAAGIGAAADQADRLSRALDAAGAKLNTAQHALLVSQVKAQFGKDKVGAAGALARLDFNQTNPGFAPNSPEGIAWAKLRDQTVSTATQTARADASYKSETKGGSKRLTDEQRAEQHILKDLHGSAQDYATALQALNNLRDTGKISSAEYSQELTKEKLKYTETTDAAKFYDQTLTNFESSALDAMNAGKGLSGVIRDLGMTFLKAEEQALLFGTGPISGGGTATNPNGGIFGTLMSGLGHILGFASGTGSAPGGLAWVGENGPELVNLPGRSQVFTATESRRMASQQQSAATPTELHISVSDFLNVTAQKAGAFAAVKVVQQTQQQGRRS